MNCLQPNLQVDYPAGIPVVSKVNWPAEAPVVSKLAGITWPG